MKTDKITTVTVIHGHGMRVGNIVSMQLVLDRASRRYWVKQVDSDNVFKAMPYHWWKWVWVKFYTWRHNLNGDA